jgi:hypothetical protein
LASDPISAAVPLTLNYADSFIYLWLDRTAFEFVNNEVGNNVLSKIYDYKQGQELLYDVLCHFEYLLCHPMNQTLQLFVLPTKTTCTLANLQQMSTRNTVRLCLLNTYAAVHAKISILRAFVTTAKPQEKIKVHAQRTASLPPKFFTKYNMMIETKGVIDAKAVPKILITPMMYVSGRENRLLSIVRSSGSDRTGL